MSEEQNIQLSETIEEETITQDTASLEKDIPNIEFHKKDWDYQRDNLILSKIPGKDLMEYLRLEQERNEHLAQIKDKNVERIFNAFRLSISLAAVVAIVYFLKDNPSILVNILYIFGILAGFWIWKDKKDKTDK